MSNSLPPDRNRPFLRKKIGDMDVVLLPAPGSGLIASQVTVRRGSVDETNGEHGHASMAAGLLKRGTTTRSSSQVAFDLESIGAMTSHAAGMDSAQSTLRCAARDFPAAFAIFAECLRRPAFDEEEMEIERQAVLAHLMRVEDEKMGFTFRHYLKRIFAGHGYGHSPEGEVDDVRQISAEDCRQWHAHAYHPSGMLFVAAGEFEPDQLTALLEEHLGDWPVPTSKRDRNALAAPPDPPPAPMELSKPLEQGFQIVGFRTPALTHPDHAALRLASAALGEGFSGRLFTRLRDERSLAYAVGSSLQSLRLCGHLMLYIGTQPDRLDEALEGLLGETRTLREELLGEDDLKRARNYVRGKYLMGHQSLRARVAHLSRWEDIGGGADQDALYLDRLKRVTSGDIRAAIERWWVDPVVVTLRPDAPATAPVTPASA